MIIINRNLFQITLFCNNKPFFSDVVLIVLCKKKLKIIFYCIMRFQVWIYSNFAVLRVCFLMVIFYLLHYFTIKIKNHYTKCRSFNLLLKLLLKLIWVHNNENFLLNVYFLHLLIFLVRIILLFFDFNLVHIFFCCF